MGIALKELIRRPGRFVSVGGALTLLVVLLTVLGGFLDGLELNQTGPYRAHDDRLLVFADDSELLIQRSRVDDSARQQANDADGVASVGGLSLVQSTAGPAGTNSTAGTDSTNGGDVVDVVLFGYELATATIPEPPDGDGAVVDAALADRIELVVGDVLAIGPSSEPVTVAAIVDDLSQGSPTIWLSVERWRTIVGAGNPSLLPPEGINQALVIEPDNDSAGGLADLAATLNQLDGLQAVTAEEAIDALPVVAQQSSTFQGIIGVTFVVTLLVVALFFALITLERVGLYAVLKALGARTGDLIRGISAQAVAISVVALVLGFALSIVFVSAIPDELPVRLVPFRLAQIAGGVLITSLVGSLFTLRRILAIDPAEAIG